MLVFIMHLSRHIWWGMVSSRDLALVLDKCPWALCCSGAGGLAGQGHAAVCCWAVPGSQPGTEPVEMDVCPGEP